MPEHMAAPLLKFLKGNRFHINIEITQQAQELNQSGLLLLLAAAVTYEPPGLTGVAHMQWLERLSSPKVS